MNYTKGPWHIIETNSIKNKDQKDYLLANSTPYIHGYFLGTMKNEDLALIAAAPDLFEAAQKVVNMLVEQNQSCNAEVLMLENALSKARGLE